MNLQWIWVPHLLAWDNPRWVDMPLKFSHSLPLSLTLSDAFRDFFEKCTLKLKISFNVVYSFI